MFTGTVLEDIPDMDLTITTDFAATDGTLFRFSAGTLTAGSYLTATFQNFLVTVDSGGVNFAANLVYTGGSYAGSLTTGRIEGELRGLSTLDLSGDFTALRVQAKIGQVQLIPLPASIWLMGSAIAGVFLSGRVRQNRHPSFALLAA